jgi:phosphatidylserine/phosphatidylglycerophosphate/cardiolipin synthase-like enzyme
MRQCMGKRSVSDLYTGGNGMQGTGRKKWACMIVLLFVCIYVAVIVHHKTKPLPEGIPYEGKMHHVPADSISFLYDLTYKKGDQIKHEQELFQHVFQAIDEAERFIVLDFFLYNDYYDKELRFPPLSSALTKKLIAKKKENPGIDIVLITDEINTSYNSHKNWQFEQLKKNGIDVLLTDTDPLRDSNPLYSAAWRMFFQWFGEKGKGAMPNAMANNAPPMTIRSYLKLLNVKANHRKTVTTDKTALILSGNPHDASAYHSNIGFQINGPIIADLLESEQAAANLAGGRKLPEYEGPASSNGDHRVQMVTEGKVLERTLAAINGAQKGDKIRIAMFYLAERKVIAALVDAHKRGADIKMILDPNENAFGAKKSGLPNRPVAMEIYEKTRGGIAIRWYHAGQEQYHPKLMYIKKRHQAVILGGSANFTARNLDNFNLETDVYIEAPPDSPLVRELDGYFSRQWENRGGAFTLDADEKLSGLTFLQQAVYALQKIFDFTTY